MRRSAPSRRPRSRRGRGGDRARRRSAPRRVADDRETPRVAGVEPDSGTEASAPRAATTAASAGDAAAFLGDAAEEDARSDARSDARAALHATARALDFEPRARDSPTKLAEGKRSERERRAALRHAFLAQSRDAAFAARGARRVRGVARRGTRASRRIRSPKPEPRAWRSARGASWRAWEERASSGRAASPPGRWRSPRAPPRRAGSLLARAPPSCGRHLSVSGACDSGDSGDSGEASTSASAETERPPYGVLDEKLARWLGVDAVSVPGALRRVLRGDDVFRNRDRSTSRFETRARRRENARAKNAAGRDGGADGGGAARRRRARARSRRACTESLEADLYAAAVVWEETERENRLLTERVAAMREDAERMTAALAAAGGRRRGGARGDCGDGGEARRDGFRARVGARLVGRASTPTEAYSRGTSYAHSRGDHTAHAPRRTRRR